MTAKQVNKSERIDELEIRLLSPHKTVRDAVHGDIMITHLETCIIDTKDFQRLRRLKQLGLTNLVYPCANHTRFDHSLGTLAVAQKIIDILSSNPYREIVVNPYDKFLIRLCALLHDLCNVPYGHTLEDEGKLLLSQWKDPARVERFLGENSQIAEVLSSDEILRQLALTSLDKKYDAQEVLKSLREILVGNEEKKLIPSRDLLLLT